MTEALLNHDAFLRTPLPKREEALRRLGVIEQFERFAAARKRDGGGRVKSMRLFCAAEKIAFATLHRWIAANRKGGVLALVDGRGGVRQQETFSPDAFEELKHLYLDKRQPTLKSCWLTLRYLNDTQKRGWEIPSYGAVCRYIEKHIPLPVLILHREGQAAYDEKCAPYILTDFDSIEPGAFWISDHHQFNLFVRDRGQWTRPWITAWEDMRSRAIVGWHISLSPNSTTILLSLKNGIKTYGPPELAKIDNGRDYDCRMFTGQSKAERRAGEMDEKTVIGLFSLLRIKASFAIPYHPQSKAIERFFDTMDCQFSKTFETYCGKDTNRKPDDLLDYLKSGGAIKEAVTMEKFTELFGQYIEAYNKTVHGTLKDKTPLEVLHGRESKRAILDETLDLLLAVWSEPLKVGKNGVRFKNLYYGQYDAVLSRYQGKFVRVSYDPNDIRRIRVFEAESWKYVVTAEQAQLIRYHDPVAEKALREAMQQKARIRKIHKEHVSGQRKAFMSLTDLALAAMDDAAKDAPKEKPASRVAAIRTPLDGQAGIIYRRERQKKLKKAVGAENQRTLLDFDTIVVDKPARPLSELTWDEEPKQIEPKLNLHLWDQYS